MDNAVVPINKPANLPVADGLTGRMAALPARAKFMAGLGVAALLAVLVALSLTMRQGDYKVLFANLSEKDGGPIIEKLSQMNVPYRYTEGGGAILVPASMVYDLRLKLSAAGLPKGSVNGYEILDKSPFGQTQGQERINLQRALEGELTRTIQSLDSVQAARVHLALPKMDGFFREQQKPSASVVLTLHPGRTLDRAQLAGIVHLVASSVPELNPKTVSVLDGSGALLSGQNEVNAQGLDGQQIQYVREVEASHLKRVLELLEPVVGRDNLRATVTAEIDFSQTEALSEAFKPNQGQGQATVREQRSDDNSQAGSATPSGVPGATSNQPPLPASAPIDGQAQAMQGAQGGTTGGTGRREAETKYEVDKTTRWTKNATGNVRRLNAAVVVNHRVSTDPKGKSVSTPLTPEELEKLTALVEQGIGFNKERGDSVRVINAPFRIEAVPPVEAVPLWMQPWLQDMLRAGAAPAALALVALVIVFTLIRPALRAVLAPPLPVKGDQLDELVEGETALPALAAPEASAMLTGPDNNARLDGIRAMAKDNPAAVANIVRGWVNGEPA